MLLRRQASLHAVVRLAQKSVFCEHAACFYDLAHCPTSGSSEVSHACQDTAIQPVGRALTQLPL